MPTPPSELDQSRELKAPAPAPAGARLTSLDAYRGFVMLAMASEGLGISRVARSFKESAFWQFLSHQTSHAEWIGCSFWDLIQPSFMFMVGVSMPFSCAGRQARGESYRRMLLHAVYRSLVLILLGIFLRSNHRSQTYFTFEDVLSQIGLGYTFLFLLWGRSVKTQFAWALGILAAYWLAFLLYPLPGPDFDYPSVGVASEWPRLQGMAAHWEKNTNLAAAFDQWFLNLFPREKPFVYNGGGYQTLSFIPSLATMIFGLLAGGLLKSGRRGGEKLRLLVLAGVASLGVGAGLNAAGICPLVKRIWTPSWAIFSAGWTCLLLGGFFALIDLRGTRRWAMPLVVVGMNSIAIYCLAGLTGDWIGHSLKVHLGQQVFRLAGETYEPIVESAAVLLVLWLIGFWLYRKKIFIRI